MIPRTVYEAEHELFRETVHRFLEAEAGPHHEQWEKDGQVSREIWLKAGEQGFLCPQVSQEYGGLGCDFRYNAIVDEAVGSTGFSGIGWGLHSDIVAPYIEHYGSEEQKKHWLPKMVSGEVITAIAMSEPGAGSDLQGIKTTAVRDGDDWVLNGSKIFITNGYMADMVIVVAKTDPKAGAKGTSLFLVPAETEGFEKGNKLQKVGMKAQDTAELFFNDCRLPADALLGEEGMGFVYLMQELPQERLNIALSAAAGCVSVVQRTIEYTKERQAFNQSVFDFQNTQFELAEMNAQADAMQVFIDRCLELHIKGELDVPTAAKAKLLSTDLQCQIIDRCVQLHGGYGYMWEYPVARAYADARVQRIYGGSNEVMKLIIARSL